MNRQYEQLVFLMFAIFAFWFLIAHRWFSVAQNSGGDVGEALLEIGGIGFTTTPAVARTAWYAVQTLYRHEQRIAGDLAVKGFATYLPLIRETRQWTDRKKIIDLPAFSGYIFVRQDASLASRVRVLETSGVLRLLGDNHAPVPVPDIEIESLRRMLESDMACTRCGYLPVGSLVQVKSGVLAGIRGRLNRVNNSLRLVLSVSTLSQAISVEVDLDDVEPIPSSTGWQSSPCDLEAAVLGA